MFRIIYLGTYLVANLLYLLLFIKKVQRIEKLTLHDKMYDFVFNTAYRIGNGLVKRSGSSIYILGTEKIPDGPVLFVSNHQSNFDIPLMLSFVNKPKSFIAKIELANIPLLSCWLKAGNCVFIDRENPRQSLKVINEGIEILKSGHSMVIFPEGTRSKGPQIQDFKKGSLRLATKSGVPIVPVTIKDSYKMYEENNGRIRPARVTITVSDPIYTVNLTKEEENGLSDKIYEIIKSNL